MTRSSSGGSKLPRILSHYRLGRLLGSGAMGSVYEGVDRRDDSPVAVKLLHAHLTRDKTYRERFEREAHIGVLLRSPYTVHLLDYGVQADHYFIVMEFVDGATLRALMESGPLPAERALGIAVQIARALEEAQARGVVHRDIKPDNILVTPDDSVKVTDFGIARQIAGGTLTMPGGFLGTLSYAAPEQFLGIADHRSDIYSLGATLYDALTGRPPFRGTLEEMASAVRSQLDVRPLAGQPAAVVQVIQRCLEKEPERRYQSASELAADLDRAARALDELPGTAPTVVGDTVPTVREEAPPAVPEETPPTVQEAPQEAQPPQKAIPELPVLPAESGSGRRFPLGGRLAAVAVLLAAAAAAAVAFLLLGGSGGSGKVVSVADVKLDTLVLSAQQLGPGYAAFQPAFSGPVSNEELVKTVCPGAAAAGTDRLSGHRLAFQAPASAPTPVPVAGAAPAPVSPQNAVFLVSTEVELFAGRDGAARSLREMQEDIVANPRVVSCAELVPEGDVVAFRSEGIGEDARGLEMDVRRSPPAAFNAASALGGAAEAHRLTVIRFLRKNLVATVTVGDVNGQPQRAEAIRLARALDEKVRTALGEPSPTPRPTPGPTGPPALGSGGVSPSAVAASTPPPGGTRATSAPPAGTQPPAQQPPGQQPTAPPAVTQPPVQPPTQPPVQPPQPTPEPPPPVVNYVSTGTWYFTFFVSYNDCGFGPEEGSFVPHSMGLYEAIDSDGYISDGEVASIYDHNGAYIGDYYFSYPVFVFESPLSPGDFVRTTLEFSGPSDGLASREEYYPTDFGDDCLIYFEE
ncbi:MAG: protein kinase [Dehalococcoidia bacterium]|nr:protein kinase [Dehalococcoidia bacterium]